MATTNIFSLTWTKNVLEWLTAISAPTAPTNLYLALLSATGTADDGTGCTEFTNYRLTNSSGNQVNRHQITFVLNALANGSTSQSVSSGGASASQVFYIEGTETITGIAICTALAKSTALTWGSQASPTTGNVLWFGSLTPTVNVVSGNTLTFGSGQVTINLG